MRLDSFDLHVLDQSGDAQDIMFELYNDKIGKNNAGKQLAGIRKHINFKLSAAEEREISEMEETITKADGSVTTKRMLLLSEEDSKNPQRVMELMGFDPALWEVDWCKVRRNYWDVTIKNKNWKGEKHTNHAYTCEMKVIPRINKLSTDIIKKIFDELPTKIDVQTIHTKKPSGYLLEIQPVDAHLGLLAWKLETEDKDYDLKEAEKDIKHVITTIIEQVTAYNLPIERIVLPIGQDFFHFDTTQSTTTKGTQMESDSRWQKMYHTGVKLLVWMVEALRQIAPVDCMYVASNHDKMMSYTATMFVGAYFRNCKDVTVDILPSPRKYVRYGKCLIGMAHGQDEGRRISGLMQTERMKDWGETLFHEFHVAHFHSEKVVEENGVIVRYLPPIVPKDSWHKEKGFVTSKRCSQAFVWDKDLGKVLNFRS